MAYATEQTLLSLDHYSQLIGSLNPLAFNGGVSAVIFPQGTGRCNDVWFQHTWQHADQVSREDLARQIHSAENDITSELGYKPAATWIESETHKYPQHYRPDVYNTGMVNVRSQKKALQLRHGKFIQGGQRVSTLQDTVVPAYSDADSDGFDETVTITLANIDSSAAECEVKVYHPGFNGDPQYEIRPARTTSLSGGTFTATFWAWQFFKLNLLNELPLSGFDAIDADDSNSYITSVEVRWTYNSYIQSHGLIYWEGDPRLATQCNTCCGVGCEACAFTTQNICIHVRDTNTGFVAISPASYDADDGIWRSECIAVQRDPDQATLNYYAGEQSDEYLAGYTCDPMPHYLAEAIAYLATARLERPYCACGIMTAHARDLRRDLSIVSTGDTSYFTGDEVHDNPFGTRLGEVMAWRRIRHLVDNVNSGAALG